MRAEKTHEDENETAGDNGQPTCPNASADGSNAFGRQALALLPQLDTACTNAEELATETSTHFDQHPDAEIITSLPGLGSLLNRDLATREPGANVPPYDPDCAVPPMSEPLGGCRHKVVRVLARGRGAAVSRVRVGSCRSPSSRTPPMPAESAWGFPMRPGTAIRHRRSTAR
jgi:hypothetical protein